MRKLNVTILVGVIVAALGFVMVFAYGRNVDEKVADGKETLPVLIATQAITAGASANALSEFVEVAEIPAAYAPDGVVGDLSQIAGQVALGPLAKGAQLNVASFGTSAQVVTGAVVPSKGKLAVAISTALEPGVARYIRPGSSVDAFVTYKAGEVANRTKLFASGLRVLSVEVAPRQTDSTSGATISTASTTTRAVDGVLVVLDLSPTVAERVVNAQGLGEIYLGLSAVQGEAPIHRTPTGATPNDVVNSNK